MQTTFHFELIQDERGFEIQVIWENAYQGSSGPFPTLQAALEAALLELPDEDDLGEGPNEQ